MTTSRPHESAAASDDVRSLAGDAMRFGCVPAGRMVVDRHQWLGKEKGSDEPPPSRTPGQAEGEDEPAQRERPGDDALRRRRPSQAEGEDPDGEADEVPEDE